MHKLTIEQIQGCVGRLNKLLPGRQIIAAGGCIRDVLLKKPVHDLDFFIAADAPHDFFEKLYEPLEKEFGVGWHNMDGFRQKGFDVVGTSKHSGCYGGGGTKYKDDFWVAEYQNGWYGFRTQLVFIPAIALGSDNEWVYEDPRKEVMTKFDFGLCRVWADAHRLHVGAEFRSDADQRRLTFFGSGWGSTSIERIAKLRAKFPDHRFTNRSGKPLPS